MSKSADQGLHCQITAYRVHDAPSDGVQRAMPWYAIATSHVYDPAPDTGGILSNDAAILAGATMRVFEGRVNASTQKEALHAALSALLVQLEAAGLDDCE